MYISRDARGVWKQNEMVTTDDGRRAILMENVQYE